jgi:KDO2-lipid IV(A) lauroyltransferase
MMIGSCIGLLMWVVGYRKNIVQSNLKRLFSELNLKHIFKVYDHLGRLFFEMTLLGHGLKQFSEKFSSIEGLEHWQNAKSKGSGVILISHHGGNWEVMVARGVLSGIDLLMVTKKLKPDWLHDWVESTRMECGTRATYEPKTMKDVLAHLKKGGTVGFVMDQYAGPPIGIRVPFMGVPVGTAGIVATLVRRTGAKVLLASNYRDSQGNFRVKISPEIAWISHEDPNYEQALNTANYTKLIEESIRLHWEQWLWTHRRFKGDLSPLKENEWFQGRPRH